MVVSAARGVWPGRALDGDLQLKQPDRLLRRSHRLESLLHLLLNLETPAGFAAGQRQRLTELSLGKEQQIHWQLRAAVFADCSHHLNAERVDALRSQTIDPAGVSEVSEMNSLCPVRTGYHFRPARHVQTGADQAKRAPQPAI